MVTNMSKISIIPKLRGGMIRDTEMIETSEATNSKTS